MVAILRDTSENIGELYKEHYDKVYGVVLKIVRDEDKARDVTQDVFVSLYEKIGQFEGRSEFSTWLYRVAVNRALDYLRGCGRHKTESIQELAGSSSSGLADADSIYFIDEDEDTEEKVVYRARIANLKWAIQRLKPYERETLELSLMDLREPEIGKVLGIPEGTVKSRLHRARKSLADLIYV